MQLYHGDIVYAENTDALTVVEDGYVAVENGLVEGVYGAVPETLRGAPIQDHGRALIIPAFSDLHVHASQYIQRGVGMDLLLSDWLNTYTFPQEANFKDMSYAAPIYDAYVEDMVRHGTMHACVFTTIHGESAGYLADRMAERGLYGLVGKVNMDTGSPDYLCETVEGSLRETESFLERHSGHGTVRPILTPRFAPTCTAELLKGLGALGKKYHVGVQTHLVESRWEAAEALRLFPDCHSDAEIYERAGLLGNGPAVFAHVIFPSEEDLRILKACGGMAVHCPDATNNIIAGIMPIATLRDAGVTLAMGSDIGGGHGIAVYKQVARAIQLSKMKEFYEPGLGKTIALPEAFYMATKAGGSAFGKVGSLEPGYHFNALVIDGMEDAGHAMSPEKRLERFCYIGDDRNIVARYLDGRAI